MERVNRRENDCPNAENLNNGYLPWNIQSRRLAEEGIFTFSLEYILGKNYRWRTVYGIRFNLYSW